MLTALQYELDGFTESYDPSKPSTTGCPYLPGQRVNTLDVPVEQASRLRSASLSSMRDTDLKTMRPQDRFVTPRPPPPVPAKAPLRRAGTAPAAIRHHRPARSLSPQPWTQTAKKLLRLGSQQQLRAAYGQGTHADHREHDVSPTASILGDYIDDRGRDSRSEGARSRDISPESLRRFMSSAHDDSETVFSIQDKPVPAIPEELLLEENDDDANFATTSFASNDTVPFATMLSPPPVPRRTSIPQLFTQSHNRSTSTVLARTPEQPTTAWRTDVAENTLVSANYEPEPFSFRDMASPDLSIPSSRFSVSTMSSSASSIGLFLDNDNEASGSGAAEIEEDPISFFDDSDDEDDEFMDETPSGTEEQKPFTAYSLPRYHSEQPDEKLGGDQNPRFTLGSPALLARHHSGGMPVGDTSLLTAASGDMGIDDLMNELGWLADVINSKRV